MDFLELILPKVVGKINNNIYVRSLSEEKDYSPSS